MLSWALPSNGPARAWPDASLDATRARDRTRGTLGSLPKDCSLSVACTTSSGCPGHQPHGAASRPHAHPGSRTCLDYVTGAPSVWWFSP